MTPTEDVGARVRAALAYARTDQDHAAAALNIDKRTLNRILANQRDLRITEAKTLAELTGVPLDFLLHGWTPPGELLADQLRRLARDVETLLSRQGRDIGLRDLERRKDQDRRTEYPSAVA